MKCHTFPKLKLSGVTSINDLVASDDLKFRFATDGAGNYGYLKADDSFVPFKSGGGSNPINGFAVTQRATLIFLINGDYQVLTSSGGSRTAIRDAILNNTNFFSSYTASGSYADTFTFSKNGKYIHEGTSHYKYDDWIDVSIGDTVTIGTWGGGSGETSWLFFQEEGNYTPIVPTMYSDTTPYGEAFADSVFRVNSYDAYRAFDKSIATQWCPPYGKYPCWIGYKSTVQVCVKKFEFITTGRYPTRFILQGSNDGSTYHDITDVLSNNVKGTYVHYMSDNTSYYQYHRLYITQSNDMTYNPAIEELQFYSTD